MSILIKGMEMPSCNDCPLAGDFKCNLMPSIPALCKEYDIAVQNGKRLDNCHLIELPPHGRLIDADAFLNTIRPICDEDANAACTFETVKRLMIEHINNAPTIIESEEEDD